MRITIDTGYFPSEKHKIKVHGTYTMDELIKFLSKFYPDFTWKDLEITDQLPEQSKGLWDQIHKASTPTWPSSGSGTPYTGNPITYTGTGITNGAGTTTAGLETLQQYMDAISKK
jgi:hypothetical protein